MNRSLRLGLPALALVGLAAYWHHDNRMSYSPREDATSGAGFKGAMEWLSMVRSNVITGKVEDIDYLEMRKAAMAAMAQQGKAVGLQWTEMGPSNVGGRTRSIVIDPTDQNTIWAGGVSGGLWKSTNGANTWQNVAGMDENAIVASIAFLGNGHLYVATGCMFDGPSGTGGSGFIGTGLYKSTDGGSSFTLVEGPTAPWSTSAAFSSFSKIAADPANSDGLYVGHNAGFRYYDESDDTFTVPTNIPTGSPCRAIEVSTDGSTVIVGINANQAYLSTNNGASFALISGNGAGQLTQTGVGRMEFAISPDDPDYIYALQSNGSGQMNGVFSSTDRGSTWSRIWPAGFGTNGVPSLDIFGDNSQGWYDNVCAVRPGNPEEVWVGGVSLWKTTLSGAPEQIALASDFPGCFICVHADVHEITFAGPNIAYIGCDGGVYKSVDGLSFTSAVRDYNVTQFYSMAFSPKGRVLGGTQDNGTQYITGAAPPPFHMDALDVFGGDGFDCEISQLNKNIMFATIYTGALARSNDEGNNFGGFYDTRILALGEPGDITGNGLGDFYTNIALHEDYDDENSPYEVENVVGVAEADIPPGGTQLVWYDGDVVGVPQSAVYTNMTGSTIPAGEPIGPLTLPDKVTSAFAVGFSGSDGVWVTRDALNFLDSVQWWQVATNIGNVNCMAWSKSGNHLFCGVGNNVVRISGFNGAYDFDHADLTGANYGSTMSVTSSASLGAVVTGLAPDPNDDTRLMVTLGQYGGSGKVRVSTNATGAMNFTSVWNVPTGLNGMPVYDGIIHAGNPNIMVVGTEFGIMATDDGGTSWAFENNNIPGVPTFAVRQQKMKWDTNPYGPDYVTNPWVIYAGTHGRGIWRTETLLGIQPGITPNDPLSTLTVFPNPVTDQATIGFSLNDRNAVSLRVYDMNGRLVVQQDLGARAPGTHRITVDMRQQVTGAYIAEMTAGASRRTARIVVQH